MEQKLEEHFRTTELSIIPAKAQRTSPKKAIFNAILVILVIALGLYFTFKFATDFSSSGESKSFIEAFSEMNGWIGLAAVGLIVLYFITDALKYHVITKTATGGASFLISLKVAFLGKFYDSITPSSTGGQPMQILYMTKKGYKGGEATAVTMTKFFVQMFSWSVVGGILMLCGIPALSTITDGALRTTLVVLAWIGFGMILSLPLFTITFVIFPKFTHKFVTGAVKLGKKMHLVKNEERILARANSASDDFVASVRLMCTSPLNFAVLIILCILEPLITVSLPYVLLIAFSNDPFVWSNYFAVICLYMYAHNSAAVAAFLPGNSGAFELTLSMALSGVSKNVSSWVIFSFRFLTYYINILIGLVMLGYSFFKKLHEKRKNKKMIYDMIVNRKLLKEPEVKKSVAVLLSTYNGEKYLRELLDSLNDQIGVNLHLIVRDDGSKDGTVNILKEYEKAGKIEKLVLGENVGFQKSFHFLMEMAPECDFYAFSDQDDIWDKDKLLYGVKTLEREPNQDIPLLYWTAFRSIDKTGHVYKAFSVRPPFGDCSPIIMDLNTNDVRGCTCVFNKITLEKMLGMGKDGYAFHDWTMQLICCLLGKEDYDPVPHISYRAHDTNCFGPARISIKSLKRGLRFLKTTETHNNHSLRAKEILKVYGDEIRDQKAKEFLMDVASYQTDPKIKKKLLKNKEFLPNVPLIQRIFFRRLIKHNQY